MYGLLVGTERRWGIWRRNSVSIVHHIELVKGERAYAGQDFQREKADLLVGFTQESQRRRGLWRGLFNLHGGCRWLFYAGDLV
jgi:hypothetical protein